MRKLIIELFKPLNESIHTNVFGLARTMLVASTLLTLIFNDTTILFAQGVGSNPPTCIGSAKLSIFCILDPHYELARYVSIIILIIAGSGWRPQITCVLHAWVAYSLKASASILEGGDQVASLLSLLLLPICLTDERKWHWELPVPSSEKISVAHDISNFAAYSAYFVIRLQVAYIYFDAASKKFNVQEWLDGTALYYWFSNSYFGATDLFKFILMPLVTSPLVAPILTWSVWIFELLLFTGLVMPKKYHSILLRSGLVFHFFIALIHGLIPFFFSMGGALILYLRPLNMKFYFGRFEK